MTIRTTEAIDDLTTALWWRWLLGAAHLGSTGVGWWMAAWGELPIASLTEFVSILQIREDNESG
jgi:hypothetical protein